jgi:hypothetical protein
LKNANPFSKTTMVQTRKKALGLLMETVNKNRLADGLPALNETDPSLTALAQGAADRWAFLLENF